MRMCKSPHPHPADICKGIAKLAGGLKARQHNRATPKKLWGGRSSGHNYSEALFLYLRQNHYTPSDWNPCLFTEQKVQHVISIAITVDDVLVTASVNSVVE